MILAVAEMNLQGKSIHSRNSLDLCWDEISQYFPSFPWELPGALSVNIRNSRFGCIERDDMEDEVMGGSFNPIHLGHALLDSSLASPAILSNRKYSLFVHNCAQLLAALYLQCIDVHISVFIYLYICAVYMSMFIHASTKAITVRETKPVDEVLLAPWHTLTESVQPDHFTSKSELPEAGNHK